MAPQARRGGVREQPLPVISGQGSRGTWSEASGRACVARAQWQGLGGAEAPGGAPHPGVGGHGSPCQVSGVAWRIRLGLLPGVPFCTGFLHPSAVIVTQHE